MKPTALNFSSLSIQWEPLIPAFWLVTACFLFACLFLFSLMYRKKGSWLRLFATGALLLVLANPTLMREERQAAQDVALLVIDESPSQEFAQRQDRTQKAVQHAVSSLRALENIELRVVRAGALAQGLTTRTDLFKAIDTAYANVPLSRRAGVVIISDGQIHDVPGYPWHEGARLSAEGPGPAGEKKESAITSGNEEGWNKLSGGRAFGTENKRKTGAADTGEDEEMHAADTYGPVHLLLTGSKKDKDRQLIVEKAPAYGIVGQSTKVSLRVIDSGNMRKQKVKVTVRVDKGDLIRRFVEPGETVELEFPVTHAGQNVYEVEADTEEGELTYLNNKTAVLINGVRDRLKVLLISGKPHPGERTWRNILTSDPAVDLVHFTILREPHKLNNVPQSDLSLIPFPFRELFEVKLYDFDLIIFDRYRANRIMPKYYFNNIAKYVRQGGALLEASGPAFASGQSIYDTALGDILPASPTGNVIEVPFRPKVTELGGRHPVTRDLHWAGGKQWGRWTRQVEVMPRQGKTVMNGAEGRPLLILDKVEDGRVAHLTSDLIWLWARGYERGGPQADLLRRLAHWLMKEPELEENALDVEISGSDVLVRRRSLEGGDGLLTVTSPDDEREKVEFEGSDAQSGWSEARYKASYPGIYRFSSDGMTRAALIGDYNPPEYQSVVTTADLAEPLIKETGGEVVWLEEQAEPAIRHMPANASFAGYGWIGLRANTDYTVTGLRAKNLLPDITSLVLMLCLFATVWWREGQTS